MQAMLRTVRVQGHSTAEHDLPDAFHRLLMHGLAQYYGLQSRSCSKDDQRLLQVALLPSTVLCALSELAAVLAELVVCFAVGALKLRLSRLLHHEAAML